MGTNLKCIGGPLNGETRYVESELIKYNRPVRLADTQKFKITSSSVRECPQEMTVSYHCYKVTLYCYNDHKRWFLIPEDWSPLDAMDFLLSK